MVNFIICWYFNFKLWVMFFGEALTLKNNGKAWFLFGTISLLLINAGVSLMIGANIYNK